MKNKLYPVLSFALALSLLCAGCGKNAAAQSGLPQPDSAPAQSQTESAAQSASAPAQSAPAGQPSADTPDYAKPESWAIYEPQGGKTADLFLICPTVSGGSETQLNMELSNQKDMDSFLGALNMERGIYDGTCNVYAPYYRQATLYIYTADAAVQQAALEFAYADVRRAFEAYLQTADPARPLVLAGFSQGSDLMLRLMKEYFADPALQERLVAAYEIGWRLLQKDCDAYPALKAAQGETDLGVIVSFNSEAPGVTDSLMVPAGDKTLAINPLNWKTDSTPADSSLNPGACFTDYSGAITREVPGLCGAYLDPERGTLKITGVTPDDYPPVLPIFSAGVYHLYDYQFFYRSLQQNVAARTEAFLQKSSLSAAA